MPQYYSHIQYNKAKRQLSPANIKAALKKDPGNVSLCQLLDENDGSEEPSAKTMEALFALDLVKKQPALILNALSLRARNLFWEQEKAKATIDLIERGLPFLKASLPDQLVEERVQLWWVYGAALAEKSRAKEAKVAYETALREISLLGGYLSNQDTTMDAYFCFRLADLETSIEAKQKHWRRAIDYIHEALFKHYRATADTWFALACAWSLLGKKQPCLEASAIALALGQDPADFKSDSDFDFVRKEPKFKALLQKKKKENTSKQTLLQQSYLARRIAEAASTEEAERLSLIRVRYDLAPQLGELIIKGFPKDSQKKKILACLDQGQWKGDFYVYDFEGGSQEAPFFHICHRENEASLKLLLKRGMSPSAHDYAGPLMLMRTDSVKRRQMFETLLDHGLDVNSKPLRLEDALGGHVAESLLIHAIRESNTQIACLLVERGARISDRTWDGVTAVELAIQKQLDLVLKAMEASGQPIKKSTKASMGNVIPKTSDIVYVMRALQEPAEPTGHYAYDESAKSYVTDVPFSECGAGPFHLLTLDLTAFPTFPQQVKRWKTYHAIIENLWCENCEPTQMTRTLLRNPKGLLKSQRIVKKRRDCEEPERVFTKTYLSVDREIPIDKCDSSENWYGKTNWSLIQIGGVPRWTQPNCPEWPEEEREAFFFIGQMKDYDTGDSFFFFLGVETGQQVIVHQMT